MIRVLPYLAASLLAFTRKDIDRVAAETRNASVAS